MFDWEGWRRSQAKLSDSHFHFWSIPNRLHDHCHHHHHPPHHHHHHHYIRHYCHYYRHRHYLHRHHKDHNNNKLSIAIITTNLGHQNRPHLHHSRRRRHHHHHHHHHHCPQALAKRYSQLKPTWTKLQNQNLLRRVAKRYRQVESAHKKPFNRLNTTV